MSEYRFDQDAWLSRIEYRGSRTPTLETLRGLVEAHSAAISYESIDVLLDRPPKLDLASLQQKMIGNLRGGYCFEQNMLFRGGLLSLGFDITSLQARVVRGLAIDAPRPMLHMVLQVNLAGGALSRRCRLRQSGAHGAAAILADLEQDTPHEVMRFIRMGDELTLQSRVGDRWEHIYRVVLLPRVDAEYEICNWFTASHPDSPYRSNLIAARPGPEPDPDHAVQCQAECPPCNRRGRAADACRRARVSRCAHRYIWIEALSDELATALDTVARKGTQGAPHPFFA